MISTEEIPSVSRVIDKVILLQEMQDLILQTIRSFIVILY